MYWYLKVLRQYTDFNGRARRKEFWMFFLFNLLFAVLAVILDNLLGTTLSVLPSDLSYGYLYFGYGLAVFIPGLAVSVRRLHDIGKSGWWYFIVLIPLIGVIWLIVMMATDSKPGENKYGPNPKEMTL